MRTISKYIAVLLLMLTTTTAQAQTQTHKLTLVSTIGQSMTISIYKHSSTGNWNWLDNVYNEWAEASCDLAVGDSVVLEAIAYSYSGWKYTYMEYEGKKIHEGEMGSSDEWPRFIMPDHDVTIYVHGEFDPETPGDAGQDLPNPKNPNSNSWNPATGEVFMNDASQSLDDLRKRFGFTNDSIKSFVISYAVGNIDNQPAGVLADLRAGNHYYPNLETLDLRHIYDYFFDSNYYWNPDGFPMSGENFLYISFWGTGSLKRLILPASLKGLADRDMFKVYQGESHLEELICYAEVPPYILQETIDDLPKSCVLYVPEQSIAVYKSDKYWGQMADIRAIPEGEVEDITVDLPDDFKDGRYVGMSLQLFNARTGEEKKYIIDERGSYIFRSMTSDEPYTAQILNPQDVLVATTDTLTLGNKPMEMTFTRVKKLYDLTLTVQTPAEQEGDSPTDVTERTSIVWTDGIGNRIATDNTLARQIEGSRVFYGISLPSEISAHYGVPPRTELVVKEGTANTIITLAQPDSVILSGKVTDTDGKPIALATVTASLMMNGTVGKTFTTTADQLGRYELTALTGDLTLNATARGYVSERVNVTVTEEQKTIEPIQLSELSGPTIVYDFTYTATPAVGGESTAMPGYSDYANVAITAYNETTGQSIDSLMVSYPEVQLLEGAKTGDRIRLTASSLKEAFMPVEATATLHEEKGDTITFAIVQKGAIEASFERTNNQTVTVSLYDAEGQLVSTHEFAEATMTLSELLDGQYTLVMMGSDPLLNKTRLLNDYASIGLTEGTDYVQKKVTVKSGTTAVASVEEVPLLNTSSFYYTDDTKTLFMPNKPEVSTSCNVTLRAEIGFKEDIKERVSNVRLLVDYPSDKAEFVEGSSMAGNKMVRATDKDGRLTIPVEKEFIDEPVRFILTALDQGLLLSSAYVQFDIDGREVIQPIGFATCEVKYMTIVAPEKVSKLEFPVRGNAPALSPVKLYANGSLLVGETQAMADGSWQIHVELPGCPNLATIPLHAVITTKQGREVKTETVKVFYNKDAIRPLHVYMYPPLNLTEGGINYKAISDKENLRIDFDFDHPETIDKQWYTSYNHVSSPFLFEIVFNTIDSSMVHNVYLEYQTVKGGFDFLRAEYDGNTGHWMCSMNLKEDAVNNVDVIFEDATKPQMDGDNLNVNINLMEAINDNIQSFKNEVNELLARMGNEGDATKRYELFCEFLDLIGFDASQVEEEVPEGMTFDEALAQAMATVNEFNLGVEVPGGMSIYDINYGENMHITHAAGLNVSDLLAEGYEEIESTDGHICYQLVTEAHTVFVDFQNDICIEVTGEQAALLAKMRNAKGLDLVEAVNDFVSSMNSWITLFNQGVEILKGSADTARKLIIPLYQAADKSLLALKATAEGGRALTAAEQTAVGTLGVTKWFLDGADKVLVCVKQYGINPEEVFKLFAKSPANTALAKTVNTSLNALKGLGTALSYVTVVNDLIEGITKVTRLFELYNAVPYPCKSDEAEAERLKQDIANFVVGETVWFGVLATADLAGTEAMNKGALAIPIPPFGVGLSTMMGGVAGTLIKMGANWLNGQLYDHNYQDYNNRLNELDCDHEMWKKRIRAQYQMEKRFAENRRKHLRVCIDPSGYVYEAVADNRVENATATIYFKQTGEDEYGDLHDEVW